MKRSKDKFYMKQIFDCILDGEIIATGKIAKEIGLSEKSVRNRLNELSDFLLENKLGEIQRKPRVGIWLEANENQKEENNDYTYEEYLGIIDIPKISLYKGFYDKTSNLNNVKFNLYVLPESSYPDVTNGNLIIAGHSGNYNNSYFANLYKLEKEDTITIHYNNSKYIYKITNIYNEEKTGGDTP